MQGSLDRDGSSDDGYRYGVDWFSRNIPSLAVHLAPFVGRDQLTALEIGSWEGRSAVWLLTHVLTGSNCALHCVDPWRDDENGVAEASFDFNMSRYSQVGKTSVVKYKTDSFDVCRTFDKQTFDIIYIDGSHFARDVLTDVVLAWPLVKPGGLMICDDYALGDEMQLHDGFDPRIMSWPPRGPQCAIDAFLLCFEGECIVLHMDWQVIIQKKDPNLV